MFPINWSQFIPDLLVGIIIVMLTGMVVYIRSINIRNLLQNILRQVRIPINAFIRIWRIGFLVLIGITIFITSSNLLFIGLSMILYLFGLFSGNRITINNLFKNRNKFIQIPILPGVGNTNIGYRFINPPNGHVLWEGIPFLFEQNMLIIDTSEFIRHPTFDSDGTKRRGVDIVLDHPINRINRFYVLVNSSNSNALYRQKVIGSIIFTFDEAPSIIEHIILGDNVREWCPGNQGDYVREATNPRLRMSVWTGLSKGGANAVIDCLEIPNYSCMSNVNLVSISLLHRELLIPPDTMGVHLSILGIVLELQ